MIYIHSHNTVTFYDAPETIERAIHDLLMRTEDTEVGMGHDGALTQSAYEQGLNDGWEGAGKILSMEHEEREDCFGVSDLNTNNGRGLILHRGCRDCLEIIKAYEEEQKKAKAEAELRVGDEIEVKGASADVPRMVITQIDNHYVSTVDANGDTRCIDKNTNRLVKTGRHFGQIEEVMWQMKGD